MALVDDITGHKNMPDSLHGQIIEYGWNCQCGSCGYGGEGWASSPALRGHPILGTDSTDCPGCGVIFHGVYKAYGCLKEADQ